MLLLIVSVSFSLSLHSSLPRNKDLCGPWHIWGPHSGYPWVYQGDRSIQDPHWEGDRRRYTYTQTSTHSHTHTNTLIHSCLTGLCHLPVGGRRSFNVGEDSSSFKCAIMIYFHSIYVIAVYSLYSIVHTKEYAFFRFPAPHYRFLCSDCGNNKALTALANKRKCKNRFKAFYRRWKREFY